MLTYAFFLPNFGMWEMIILAGIGLLFFGNRLPSVMRSLGQSVVEFKKGLKDDNPQDRPPSVS
jgi:sec-independent protein translocase protein TatA